MDNMRMDKRVTEYLAWLNNQFENALDAADSDVPSEYQEGLTDGFDRAEAAFRDIFDVKEQWCANRKRKHIMSETDTGNTQIDKRVECVVLPGDRRSGISCDWANATKETDE